MLNYKLDIWLNSGGDERFPFSKWVGTIVNWKNHRKSNPNEIETIKFQTLILFSSQFLGKTERLCLWLWEWISSPSCRFWMRVVTGLVRFLVYFWTEYVTRVGVPHLTIQKENSLLSVARASSIRPLHLFPQQRLGLEHRASNDVLTKRASLSMLLKDNEGKWWNKY